MERHKPVIGSRYKDNLYYLLPIHQHQCSSVKRGKRESLSVSDGFNASVM